MRRVTIKYGDGHIDVFRDMQSAAAHLGITAKTIRRAELGRGGRTWPSLASRGIVSIKTDEPKRYNAASGGSRRHQGHVQRVLVTNELTGEETRCASIKEAKSLTGASVMVTFWLDDGEYHRGWRYDSMDYDDTIEFGDIEVTDDQIGQLYRIYRHYVFRYWHLDPNDGDVMDIMQDAVTRVAAEISRGEYDPAKWKNWGYWAYARVKSNASWRLRKMVRERASRIECPDDGTDAGEWIEGMALMDDEEADEEYLENIPERHRELARLLMEGYTSVEISCIWGISPSAVSQRKIRLRKWLEGGRGEETDESDA